MGITTGYADGTFRPDEPVARAQLAVFLTRAFNGKGLHLEMVDDPVDYRNPRWTGR